MAYISTIPLEECIRRIIVKRGMSDEKNAPMHAYCIIRNSAQYGRPVMKEIDRYFRRGK